MALGSDLVPIGLPLACFKDTIITAASWVTRLGNFWKSLVTKFLQLDDLRGLFALNWKLKFGHLQEIWSYALIFGLRSSWTGGIRLYELSIYNRYLSSFNIFSFIISKNRCDLTTQRTNVCIVIGKSLDYNTTFYSNGSWGQCHKTFLTLMAISQNNKNYFSRLNKIQMYL